MSKALVTCRDLRKTYRGTSRTEALRGVNLDLQPGEILALIGPNGAGKTTTLNLLAGLLHPTEGEVLVGGHPPGSLAARRILGYLPERPVVPLESLPALDQLRFVFQVRGFHGRRMDPELTELLARVGLDANHRRVAEYSMGMRQKLGFLLVTASEPKVLLLDEPTAHLDPGARQMMRKTLERARERGAGVIVSSHALTELELICDRAVFLRGGVAIARDDMRAREKRHRIRFSLSTKVEALFPRARKLSEETWELEVASPEEKDETIARLVAAGGTLHEVTVVKRGLEELFREYVGTEA